MQYGMYAIWTSLTSHHVVTSIYIRYTADTTKNQLNHFYINISLSPLFITITWFMSRKCLTILTHHNVLIFVTRDAFDLVVTAIWSSFLPSSLSLSRSLIATVTFDVVALYTLPISIQLFSSRRIWMHVYYTDTDTDTHSQKKTPVFTAIFLESWRITFSEIADVQWIPKLKLIFQKKKI